jgi:hypothetical protein
VKNPRTGKRIARVNPVEKHEIIEVPELRIVDQELWQRVKDRQSEIRDTSNQPSTGNRIAAMRRQKYLLSGLLVCGEGDGSYSIVAQDYYGCRRHRASGTCSNRALIRRQVVEQRVLSGIKQQLLTPDMVREFIAEFRSEWNRLNREHEEDKVKRANELAGIKRKIAGIISAIEDGEWNPTLKQRLHDLERRRVELEAQSVTPTSPPNLRLHPSLADLYRRKVEQLETR